jgi:hypothetical protein
MKSMKYNILIIFILMALSFSACQEDITIPFDNTYARLVVDGSMTTDTGRHFVRLTKSGDALNDKAIIPVENAIVSISDGDTSFMLTSFKNIKGLYATDSTVFGTPGRVYTLNISNVDINDDGVNEQYHASCLMKNENPIDSIGIRYFATNAHYKGWSIFLFMKDYTPGGDNYYLTKAYINGNLVTDSIMEYMNIADNSSFKGGYYASQAYTLMYDKKDERLDTGNMLTLEVDCITKEYLDYISAYIQEYYPKIPIFSGPSANIPTNLEPKDKAIGFFSAYSVQRKTLKYK